MDLDEPSVQRPINHKQKIYKQHLDAENKLYDNVILQWTNLIDHMPLKDKLILLTQMHEICYKLYGTQYWDPLAQMLDSMYKILTQQK